MVLAFFRFHSSLAKTKPLKTMLKKLEAHLLVLR